ncbi:MAG: hypothetical protein GY778_21980 [bacterium]|nr:hypothetical protein [bacterium]
MLVVVSIIALLISILLPSLRAAREQTKSLKCLANLRSIGQGIALYTNAHQGVLPGPLHPPVYRRTATTVDGFVEMDEETARPWFLLSRIGPYFAKGDDTLEYVDKVAVCPTAEQKYPDSDFLPSAPGNPSWSHPFNYLPNSWGNTAPTFYFGWVNIGVTWTGFMNFVDESEDPFNPTPGSSYHAPRNTSLIKRISDEWMVGDAWWDFEVGGFTIPGQPVTITSMGPWQLPPDGGDPQDSTGGSNNPLPRGPYHRNGKVTNLVYFDSHAAAFSGDNERWAQTFPANRKRETSP